MATNLWYRPSMGVKMRRVIRAAPLAGRAPEHASEKTKLLRFIAIWLKTSPATPARTAAEFARMWNVEPDSEAYQKALKAFEDEVRAGSGQEAVDQLPWNRIGRVDR